MTELVGAPTAGMATLAYKVLAHAQGERLTYVDLPRNIDPAYAHRCGVAVDQLQVARPSLADGWPLLEDLVARRGSGVVVVSAVDLLLHLPEQARTNPHRMEYT
jgi:hypothetical protein